MRSISPGLGLGLGKQAGVSFPSMRKYLLVNPKLLSDPKTQHLILPQRFSHWRKFCFLFLFNPNAKDKQTGRVLAMQTPNLDAYSSKRELSSSTPNGSSFNSEQAPSPHCSKKTQSNENILFLAPRWEENTSLTSTVGFPCWLGPPGDVGWGTSLVVLFPTPSA